MGSGSRKCPRGASSRACTGEHFPVAADVLHHRCPTGSQYIICYHYPEDDQTAGTTVLLDATGGSIMHQTQLQKSEREKPHSGKTKSQSPTKTPCNQPAIAILPHTRTAAVQ